MKRPLYSIGYATKPLSVFLGKLHRHGVTAIADIRSVPYSNAFFDYHREALQRTLKDHSIRYVHLGLELGPRSKDDAHYDASEQVQFDRLAASSLYRQGIERITSGLDQGFHIAMLCAEKRPEVCHRSLLVGHHLYRQDAVEVEHILHDGDLLSQAELEDRLTAAEAGDLFAPAGERNRLAMATQWQRYAYRRPSPP